jgi:carotenoid cleavage dioxygenase-like enzyme
MDAPVPTNPFLSGNFAPVRSEDDFELAVTGEMPKDLAGVLYRNGPNPQFEPRDPNYHWFGGDGMLHGFFIEGGKVRYRNRYARTPKWQVEHDAGRSLFGTFGNPMTTDPSVMGADSGVANTNIIHHAGRLLALEEAHAPFEMDAATLDSKGYVDFGGRCTAHPKTDPKTGELVFFGYGDGLVPLSNIISYGVTGADGVLKRRDSFEAPFAAMIHDFMVTERHVLFPVLPLTMSLERAMTGRPPIAWEGDKPALVGVMRRDAGVDTIRWFNTAACYVFHVMNAWEEANAIMADVMRYDVAPLFPNADGSPGRSAGAKLVRWTFDLTGATDAIREEQLDDLTAEFPRYDERLTFARNRHGWFVGASGRSGAPEADIIAHIDLTTGVRHDWTLPVGDAISEPVFVPRAADAPEGDGWLLAVAFRGRDNVSELVVLNAQDVAAGPVATARLPRRVPFGFHGNWVGAER